MGLLAFFFKFTLLGKAMRACSVNPVAASLVGINVKRVVLLSFVMSAGIGAAADIAFTPIMLMEDPVMQRAYFGRAEKAHLLKGQRY